MTDGAAAARRIGYSDFDKIDVRVGTVLTAGLNEKALKPAYVLEIDFGPELGIKTSSAQITQAYDPESLIGKQIVAVVNFEPKRVAGVRSEVLILAIVQPDGPTVLLMPDMPVKNGSRMA